MTWLRQNWYVITVLSVVLAATVGTFLVLPYFEARMPR
jgi:hypothetical protein